MRTFRRNAVLGASLLAISAGLSAYADDGGGFGSNGIKRVLLISIDGCMPWILSTARQELAGSMAAQPIARIWPGSRRRG